MKKQFSFTFYNKSSAEDLTGHVFETWKSNISDLPSYLQIPGKKHNPFLGFDDRNLLAVMKQKKDFILMDGDFNALFSCFYLNTHLNITFALGNAIHIPSVLSYIDLFLKIARSEYLYCAHAEIETFDRAVKNNKDIYNRTFLMPGLFWLNFFGPEEEKKQGGWQLEQNPYATRIERFDNGLFIQVGDTPESCLTPEGEQRLLDATKAMPPLLFPGTINEV